MKSESFTDSQWSENKPTRMVCVVKKNAKTAGWARHYQTALGQHLKRRSGATLKLAVRLGRQAVLLGLEPLDVARIHEAILARPASRRGGARSRQGMGTCARQFFVETLVPIEQTHVAAVQADERVSQLTRTLRRRTVASSTSARHLERSVARRQAAEVALKKSGRQRRHLLQESSRLHHRLQTETRGVLSAQEKARRKTSHQLHDEITQILVAINLRLLTVKVSAKASTETLEKEIAETQRLVRKSTKRIYRLANEHGGHHET